jgi:hypothetical protein
MKKYGLYGKVEHQIRNKCVIFITAATAATNTKRVIIIIIITGLT